MKARQVKSKLSKEREAILSGIRKELRHGDVKRIAAACGKSNVYVSLVLNVNNDYYNDDIVAAAAGVIAERRKATKKIHDMIAD